MGNKNLTIDIVKGMAILLVVYGHVIEHSMAPWQQADFFQNPVFKIIYSFHMPLFVFISGYLMANSLNRHGLRDVFISRCRSLLVPFVALTVLGTIVAGVLNILLGSSGGKFNLAAALVTQLFLDPKVWFLLTVFALSSLLIGSVYLEKRIGLMAFGIFYLVTMSIPYHNYGALYYIQWFYLFYAAGYWLNRFHLSISNDTLKKLVLSLAFFSFCVLVRYWTINDYIYINKMNFVSPSYLDGFLRLIYRYVMGFLGITIAFYMGAYLSRTRLASLLGAVGRYSLDIYIIQMLLLEGFYPRIIFKAGLHFDFNSPLVLGMVAPFITVFFVAVSMLISKYLFRRYHLLNTLLLGGRGVVEA